MFKELDVVKANKCISANVLKGMKGVVHQVYTDTPNFYLVEFFNQDNDTIAIIDVSENDICSSDEEIGSNL